MKTKKILYLSRALIIMLLAATSLYLRGQDNPVYNIPSPEVASLGIYGQIPVSHFTGIPDISIPLYELVSGTYKLPISANYHLASVKPNDYPGPLNMGWSLMAGGYITRNVRGAYDEIMDSKGIGHGFYTHYAKLRNLTNAQFASHTEHIESDDASWYELSADEFSFNFCGYSGNFYYNDQGGWTVVSDNEIKVEQSGFVTLDQLSSRMNTRQWGNKKRNQRYFAKFILTTPDGTRYEFGGVEALEFSIPYYARNNTDLIATTWRLVKIVTPDGRGITLQYEGQNPICDIKYSPMYAAFENGPITINQNPEKIGIRGFTGFLLFPVKLRYINTVNETVEFVYEEDSAYSQRLLPNGIKAIFWQRPTNYLGNDYYYNYNYVRGLSYTFVDDPSTQFYAFMQHVPNGFSEYEIRTNFSKAMKHYMLKEISIHQGTEFSKRIHFLYESNGRKKLTDIIERKDSLENLCMAEGMRQYHFEYNNDVKMQEEFMVSTVDTWGYYNGGRIQISSSPSSTPVLPNLTSTKAEVLIGITTPTGGQIRFDYELNNYSKRVSTSRLSLDNISGIAGGLRVKTITNIDRNGNVISKKRYYYSKNRQETSYNSQFSSGISRGIPILNKYYLFSDGSYYTERGPNAYYAPSTNHNTPDVGYSWIIEELLDTNGHSLGYTRYHYSNYDSDSDGNLLFDTPAYYSYNIVGYSYSSPYTSTSFKRGKLLSEEYFDKMGTLVRKKAYKYRCSTHPSITTAHQELVIFGYSAESGNPYYSKLGWLTQTHTASYLLEAVTDSVYTSVAGWNEKSMHEYTYNVHRMIDKERRSIGNGDFIETSYKYTYDSPEYNWMSNKFYLNYIIEKTIRSNNLERTESYVYAQSKNQIPYIQLKTSNHGDALSGRDEYEVLQADFYGNPLEIIQDGMHSAYIWGYWGQKLIAKVENCTYQQLKSAVGFQEDFTSSHYTNLYYAKSQMPWAHFYIYQYNRKLLLSSEMTPNGQTIYYNYDILGRLIESYIMEDNSKKILKRYSYKYYKIGIGA